MAVLHFANRDITAKLVYFGAPGAGSNTNVRTLYGLVAASQKGRLHQFGPADVSDQSWFFEYVAPRASSTDVPGFTLRVRVYSMPGTIRHNAHRHEVFKRADAVVFVADARPSRAAGNHAAWNELLAALRNEQLGVEQIPVLVQVNHTDSPDAIAPEAVVAGLRPAVGVIPAVANASRGVIETHEAAMRELAARLRENLAGHPGAIPLVAVTDPPVSDEALLAAHSTAIENAERSSRPSLELGVTDFKLMLHKRYQALGPGPKHEVAFQPRDFVGTRPVHLLDTRIEGDQILLDLVMDRLAGGEPKRLTVALANRPVDATPVPRVTAPAPNPRPVSVTESLPDKVELGPPEPADFPPVWYGMAGVAGGVIVGILVGFLLFG